jgi:hypothetical protein
MSVLPRDFHNNSIDSTPKSRFQSSTNGSRIISGTQEETPSQVHNGSNFPIISPRVTSQYWVNQSALKSTISKFSTMSMCSPNYNLISKRTLVAKFNDPPEKFKQDREEMISVIRADDWKNFKSLNCKETLDSETKYGPKFSSSFTNDDRGLYNYKSGKTAPNLNCDLFDTIMRKDEKLSDRKGSGWDGKDADSGVCYISANVNRSQYNKEILKSIVLRR